MKEALQGFVVMEWFVFTSRLVCHICRGMGCGYFVSYSNAVPFISLYAFLFNLPTLFLGRRNYKSLWLYADVLPILHNPSEVLSADHVVLQATLGGYERRCNGEKQK